ncbi:MAG TPA: alanine--tRNA ligase-related protein [Nocardioidaceae bacterium]|jgi:alanyl-tRNA synthetase
MQTQQILDTFLGYYTERGHQPVDGASLVPHDDGPVLFTTSGMHPLTPFIEGRRHPKGRRLTNLQRCLRTTDLEEVGDLTHLTVFQMLGTWSFGDYSGLQSLRWAVGLLCEGLGVERGRLHATVFGGDDQAPADLESEGVWQELGVPVEPTVDDNWWSNGPTGPCGPDSEIFVWTGDGPPVGTPTTDRRWVEVWNHVMMRYRRLDDGSLVPLERPSVDTGMGLERLAMVLQGTSSVFDTDVLADYCRTLEGLWGLRGANLRLVCDHLRSSMVVVDDGVRPSNVRRGYVLRRLVRRTLTALWSEDMSRTLADVPEHLVTATRTQFGTTGREGEWSHVVGEEEDRFRRLLERGRGLVSRLRSRGPLTAEDVRFLRETHGIPEELVFSPLLDAGA